MRDELSCQAGFWNRAARGRRFSHPLNVDAFRRYVDSGAGILDYGCGWGRILGELQELGYTRLTGVDPSVEMVRRAREEHPALDIRIMEPGPLPFADSSFDCVLLFAVLTCVPTDSGQRLIADEAFRVLRPGGLLYVSDYLLQDDERNRERYVRGLELHGVHGVFELPDGAVLRHHGREHIGSLLSAFETMEWFEFQVETMNGNLARAFQCLWRRKSETEDLRSDNLIYR